jgi:hypothetical protein
VNVSHTGEYQTVVAEFDVGPAECGPDRGDGVTRESNLAGANARGTDELAGDDHVLLLVH